MGTKAMTANSDQPGKKTPQLVETAKTAWADFTRFLSDVRAEMRKVVTPSRKEVQATTTVVLVAVGVFGVYFMVVDWVFDQGLHQLLGKLGGF